MKHTIIALVFAALLLFASVAEARPVAENDCTETYPYRVALLVPLHVYPGYGSGSTAVRAGTCLAVLGQADGWLSVETSGGQAGYMEASHLGRTLEHR